jgi:hypothetical protein
LTWNKVFNQFSPRKHSYDVNKLRNQLETP